MPGTSRELDVRSGCPGRQSRLLLDFQRVLGKCVELREHKRRGAHAHGPAHRRQPRSVELHHSGRVVARLGGQPLPRQCLQQRFGGKHGLQQLGDGILDQPVLRKRSIPYHVPTRGRRWGDLWLQRERAGTLAVSGGGWRPHTASPAETWSHVVVGFNDGVTSFYVNGSPDGTSTGLASTT